MIFSISRERKFFSLLFAICFLLTCATIAFAQRGANYPVVTVSAASYEANAAVAPGSLASSFGTNLTTVTAVATDTNPTTPAIELPTNLGGTTVQVNNVLCGLLYVSPTQINFAIPEELADGAFLLTINSPNGTQGGTVKVSRVQPSIFSMNSDGQGVIAASVVRVKADGSQQYESVAQLDTATNRMIPKPIDLGSAAERVFLEIYLTGIRQAQDENSDGNFNEHIFVILGGKSITPAYAGKQGFFAGIDQVNVELPRSLIGKGKLNLSIHGNMSSRLGIEAGFTSNAVEFEIAPAKTATPPIINNLSTNTANVGEVVVINGSGFGSGLLDNVVTFGGIKGDVELATPTQIVVRVPFGAKSGKVKVLNSQGEAVSPTEINFRTSLSGLIESSTITEFAPFPLHNITVRVAGTNLSTTTNQSGRFFLNDVPSGTITLEIDPSTFALSTKFPSTTLKTNIEAARDNALPATIWLNETGLFQPTQSTEWNALTGVLTDTDGVTPVPNAMLRLLGQGLLTTTQTTTTDSSGSYVFRNVASSTIVAEVIRANGKVVMVSGAINLSAAVGKLNSVGILDLSLKNAPENRKPIILAPETAMMKATQTLDVPIYIADPDTNDTLQVSVSGAAFASLIAGTNGNYTLRFNPSVPSIFGVFPIQIRVIDSKGSQTTGTITLTIPPPLISIVDKATVIMGETLDVPFTVSDFAPEKTSQISTSGMQNISVIAGTNGNYTLRLAPTTIGGFLVTINVIDSLGNQTTKTITVNVLQAVSVIQGSFIGTIKSIPVGAPVNSIAYDLNHGFYIGVSKQGIFKSIDNGETWPIKLGGFGQTDPRQVAAYDGNNILLTFNTGKLFTASDWSAKIRFACQSSPCSYGGVYQLAGDNLPFTLYWGKHSPAVTYFYYNNLISFGSDVLVHYREGSNTGYSYIHLSPDIEIPFGFRPIATSLEKDGDIYLGLLAPTQTVSYIPQTSSLAKISSAKKLTYLDFPLNEIYDLASDGNTIYAADGGLSISYDNGNSWSRLGIAEFSDGSARSIIKFKNRLVVSYSKGLLVQLENKKDWEKIPVNFEGRTIKKLFAKDADIFCITTDGVLYKLTAPPPNLTLETLDNQNWKPGDFVRFLARTNDPTVQIKATGLPGGATFTRFSSSLSGFDWTPTPNQIGTYTINVIASNNAVPSQTITKSVTITVAGTPAINSWTTISESLPNTVTTVAVDGINVYAGVYGKGVYLTTNTGISWQPRNAGLPGVYSRSIAASDNTLLVSIDEKGVFRSSDNGVTWSKTSLAAPFTAARVSVTNGVFFSDSPTLGVFYSTDQGMTWDTLTATKFATDGKGVNFAQDADGKIYKILVSGNSVTKILTNFSTSNMPRVVTATTNKYFSANPQADINTNTTYSSADSGINWNAITTFPVGSYNTLFGIEKNIYASTNQGAYSSTDEGQVWTKMLLPAFEFMVANSQYLFAKDGGNLYAMPRNLTTQVLAPIPQSNIKKLSIPNPVSALVAEGSTIYAGTYPGGILRSTDGGQTWQQLNTGINSSNKYINSLSRIGGKLFASTPSYLEAGNLYGGIFSLGPTGESWSLYYNVYPFSKFGGVSYLFGEYQSRPIVYYKNGGLPYLDGVYISMADPSSFLEFNGDLYVGLTSTQYAYAEPFGPLRASIIKYNPTSRIVTGLSTPTFITYGLVLIGTTIYASSGDITYSADAGKTWNYLAIAELSDHSAKLMIKVGDKLVVSCSKGLLVSSNPQQSWQLLPLNLDNKAINKMFTNGTDLFCLMDDGSVYQISGL